MVKIHLAILHDDGLVPPEQPSETVYGDLQRVLRGVPVRIGPELVGQLGGAY